MRVVYSFLIVMISAFLFLLPLTELSYDFRTDPVTDTFTVSTAGGITADNVTLDQFVYDDDDDTIVIASSIAEVPTMYSYNATTKTVWVTTMTANTTRTLDVTYDVDAIGATGALADFVDRWPWLWMVITVMFPLFALAALWTGRLGV